MFCLNLYLKYSYSSDYFNLINAESSKQDPTTDIKNVLSENLHDWKVGKIEKKGALSWNGRKLLNPHII